MTAIFSKKQECQCEERASKLDMDHLYEALSFANSSINVLLDNIEKTRLAIVNTTAFTKELADRIGSIDYRVTDMERRLRKLEVNNGKV